MIVFDTEGTDLIKPEVVPISDQPYLVEFAGVKLNSKTLKEEGRCHFLCHPGILLPATFTKITGITEEQIKDKKPFISSYRQLVDFFLGEEEMLSHNLGYDEGVLRYALLRVGKLLNFPWPPTHTCSVEASQSIKGHRLGLADLYLLASGKEDADRIAFAPGQFVKHKSLGHCTILSVLGDHLEVQFEDGKRKKLEAAKFKKGAAFEGAHGAMKDVEELVTCVRWLRKEGHL